MAPTKEHQLERAFGSSDVDVLEKLASFCDIFNVSPDSLFISWETFIVTKIEGDLDLTLPNLDRLQDYLQASLAQSLLSAIKPASANGVAKKRPTLRQGPMTSSPAHGGQFLSPVSNKRPRNTASLPAGKFGPPSSNPPSSPVKPSLAHESNVVVETLNPNLAENSGFDADSERPFAIASNFDASKYRFRTMAMKLLESADVLDDQIDTMAQLYQESMTVNEDDIEAKFGNPCLSSQFDILCCGRIVPDSPSHDPNVALNNTSLYLETSRMSGIGQRVPLDLKSVQGYSLFPGQIVVLMGRNPTGRTFIVEKIMPLPEIGAPVSSKEELQDIQALNKEQGLKVVVALGPFSNSHTLDYTLLTKFVEEINTKIMPHVVILNGPFIDINNTTVAEGDLDFSEMKQPPRNLDEVFSKVISPILRQINPKIQVILYPSLKDTCIKHCSYPQDAFDRRKFDLPKNIKVFPNPSSFSLNEVVVANSNLDIFKDLRDVYDEATTSEVSSNRFERIVGHMFDQRRLYPTFPGSVAKHRSLPLNHEELATLHDGINAHELIETVPGGSMLEVPYLGLTEFAGTLPDILIAPSELKYFAKVIRGVVVVNPGYFVRASRDRGREEGSYAVINIERIKLPQDDDCNVERVENTDNLYYHNVYKRSRVDIYKS